MRERAIRPLAIRVFAGDGGPRVTRFAGGECLAPLDSFFCLPIVPSGLNLASAVVEAGPPSRRAWIRSYSSLKLTELRAYGY
jgi:hypothetical protein